MKILFLGTPFPDRDDPARGIYNMELCCTLAKQHEVRAIAPRSLREVMKKRLKGKTYQPTQQAIESGVECVYPSFYYLPGFLRNHYGHFLYASTVYTLRRWRRENWTPDAVVSYWAHPDGEAGYRIAEYFGVPSAVIVGGSDVLILPKDPGRKVIVERALQKNTKVVTVSDGLHPPVESLGVDKENILTIRQGIETNRFFPGSKTEAREKIGIDKNKTTFLWVGRMVGVKGLDTLVEAASQLKEKGQEFVLYLAGDGAERSRIEQVAKERSLDNEIKCIGMINHDDLPNWYRAADITLLSSLSEGLPNVLRESLACGTPFVSTNVGSINEIADPSCAITVPPEQPTEFANAISQVLEGPYKENAQSYEPRTWQNMADDFEALLYEMTGAEDNEIEEVQKTRSFKKVANIL